MSAEQKISRAKRAASKRASRRADDLRIKKGESPALIQAENSIFPADFFKGAEISNLKQAVGR